MRFPEFIEPWDIAFLENYLVENKERNKNGDFTKNDVLSVSGEQGVVNQIELLGRSFAGKSVIPYHIARHNNIIYTKSPLSDFPYGIVKMNRGVDGIVSTLYAVYNVLPNADASFVEFYFALKHRANRYFKPIVRIGAKHDMKIGNAEVLHNLVKFPQIEEQQRISAFLELIDERIATQNKIIDNLQSLIKGLVVSHYNLSSLGNSIKISELGEPFSVMNLSKEQLSSKGQPCIIYGELFTHYGAVIDEIVSRTQVSEGITLSTGRDLLFPSSTTVDAISLIAPSALNQKGVILGGDMFCIKVDEKFSVSYLSYFFNYICASELAKYAKGSTIIHLHYKEIANHKIKLPTLEAQKECVCMATNLQCKIDIEIKMLRELQHLKSYLLDAMFI